jgi:hypothetical protein
MTEDARRCSSEIFDELDLEIQITSSLPNYVNQSVPILRSKRCKNSDHSLIYTDQVLVASSLAIAEGTKAILSQTNLFFFSTRHVGRRRS